MDNTPNRQIASGTTCHRNDGRVPSFLVLAFFASSLFLSLPTAEAVQVKKVYRGIANFDVGDALAAASIGGTVDPAKSIVLLSNSAVNTTTNAQGERNFFFVAQFSGNSTLQIERSQSDQAASVSWQVVEFADGVRVQSGISSIDKGVLTNSITLPPLSPALDINKAVPIVTFRTGTGGNNNTSYGRTNEFFLEPTLSAGPTLTLTRLKSQTTARDKPLALVWQVIEFQTDATVYTGKTCLPVPATAGGPQSAINDGLDPDGAGPCPTNSAAFSPALSNSGSNSLLFFYPKYGIGHLGEDARIFVRGTVTNGTTVTFTRGYDSTTADTQIEVRYYVVDFADGSGATGDLGKGVKGSLNTGTDPATVTITSSTDAIAPNTIEITTSAVHGYAVDNLVNVGGHTTNTAANGNWLVKTIPTTTVFGIKEPSSGADVLGSGLGAGGGTGSTAKARATDLSTPYGTIDSTRMVTFGSASATSASTATTNTWADDLLFANYLYQVGTTWNLMTTRDSSGRAIAADYEYLTYEFPSLTLKSPNGSDTLTVDSQVAVNWVSALSKASDNWSLQMSTNGGTLYSDLTTGCGATGLLACTGTATGTTLSAGTIQWKVPDNIGSTVRLRLWDTTDATADTTCKRRCDSSNNNFTIRGAITSVDTKDTGVSSPILYVDNAATTVTWSQNGSIGTVKILIDRNQDGSFTVADDPALATAVTTGASGNYSWSWAPRVANIVGENLKIRVQSESDSNVYSDTGIIKIRPLISVFEPTTTSQFLRGKTHAIKFCTTGTVGNVKIYLSTNTGVAYDPLDVNGVINGAGGTTITPTYVAGPTANCSGTAGVVQEGSWNWAVPASAPLGTSNKIKVEKSDNATVVDTGPDPVATGTFEIKASVSITGPPTTEGLRVQADKPLSWSVTGGSGVTNVSIKYTTSWSTCQNLPSTDLCWVTITTPDASNLLAGASPFQWNVPNNIGTDVGIRIQDTANPNLIYDKRGPFTIKGRIATVSAPASGEVLRVGTNKTIIWDAKGSIGPVDVCLMKEGSAACDFTIATAVALPTMSAAWNNIAATEMCTTCEIKVFLPGDPTAENADGTGGVSKKSAIFSTKGNITNAARDAASYNVGGNVVITWTATPATLGDSVNIRYDSNSGLGADGIGGNADDYPTIITTKVASTQTHTWTIPTTQTLTSGTSRVKVEYVGYPSVYSETTTFSIKGTLTLTGAAKTGGVTWKIGEPNTITWTRNGSSMTNADVKYSPDGGTTWNLIATVPSANETYTWCVGFNDGCSGTGGAAGTADDAAHTPGLVIGTDKNTQIKIRIEAVSDPAGIFDCTGATCAAATYLTIQKRYINVAVPSPTLFVGDNSAALSNISWTTHGITSTAVLLNYDTASGTGGFLNTIVGAPGASDLGGYVWDVPDAIGTAVRLRMKSSTFPTDVFGDSADFTVKGKILPVFPTGTDTLVVGNAVSGGVQYQKKGNIGNLRIEHLRTGCVTPLVITPGPTPGPEGTPNATSFAWTVASTDGCGASMIDTGGAKNSKFQFTGLGQTGALQATAQTANFQIRGELYGLKPDNGTGFDGAVFTYGTGTRYVMWKNRGAIGNIRIRLDKFSGNGADGIAGNADDFATQVSGPNVTYPTGESVPYNFDGDGAGTLCDSNNPCWEWTIPDNMATTYRIRVESLDNPASLTTGMATFVSHSLNFRVRGAVTVTTPNGIQTPHWKSGETKNIDWNVTGTTVGNFSIQLLYELDTDPAGLPYEQSLTITSNNSGTKPFPWPIPSTLSTEHALIRITALGDSTVTDDSDAEFKIKPVLALTAPNNNTFQWVVGTSYNVTWNAPLGTAPSLKINFSTNGGKGADGVLGTSDDWPDTDCVTNLALCQTNKGGLITASVAAAAGTKSWTIPDIMTNEGVVRLSKVGDTAAYDDSDSFFYIKGAITNVQVKNAAADAPPVTPIDLPIDVDKYITWDYTGSLGTVNIYYSTDANAVTPTWTIIPDPDGAGPRTSGAGVSVGSGGSGSYQWKIPNAPSPNVKVKVANVSSPNYQDVSQFNPNGATGAGTYNSIVGSVTEVTVVADGTPSTTDMEVTGSKSIQWKPNGSIATFKVEYRKNAGTWTEITPVGGCGSACFTVNGNYRQWTWTNIPDQISNDIDFKVSDYNDPVKVNCTSDNVACTPGAVTGYIIKGKLSIVSPISTDVWTLGATAVPSIRWNKQGTIGDLKIEYSTSGTFTAADVTAGYVFTIETAYPSGVNGNVDYAWAAGVIGVNRKISDVGVLRITNVLAPAGTELTALSPAFKIRPSFTGFSSPGAGLPIWYVTDTSRVITWACNSGTKGDGTLPKVTLEYNVDGGGYLPVTGAGTLDCVNGTNNYTWPSVADEKSNNATLRVKFNDYSTINLVSNTFKIHPKITVTDPTSTTKLKVGSTYANLVKWTYTGTKTLTVDIRYDTNGGAGGYPITQVVATAQAIGAGSTGVTWSNVPNIIGTNVKVKVFDPGFTEVAGESPAFKVMAGVSNVQPGGGVNRTANSTMSLTWDYTGTVTTFKAYYDLNSGKGPDNIPGTADDWTLIDSPASATACTSGSCSYSWLYNFTVPVPDNVLNTAAIKITNLSDETDVNMVGTDFKLGAGVSNLLPANGQVISAGSTNTYVTWNKDKGLAITTKMKIEYTNNASAGTPTWTTLTLPAGTDNTGSFLWTPIPGTSADLNADLRLRITQQTPDNAAVTLNGAGTPFVIKAQITVTEPVGSGSESWGLLESHDIKFTKKGALQTVDIYYAPDGTTYGALPINATPINISALADDTVFIWNWASIPANTTLSTGYSAKVKVKAVTPPAQATALAQGISAGGFQVRGSIANVLPSGATDLEVSGSKLISWTPTGSIIAFKVEYSHVPGAIPTWIEITPVGGVAGTPSGADKTWTWTNIPNTISNNVKFRVSDYNNPNANAVSAAVNIIKGKLSLVSPISTDIWTLGATPVPSIRWNKTGTIGDLKIEYSTSGTFTAADVTAGYVFTIETAYPSGVDGNVDYAWASGVIGVNRKISDTGAIKISNVSPPAGTELTVTSAVFKIRPSFTSVSSPASGNIWYVADTARVITWACNSGTKGNGTLPKVTLEYNVDAGGYLPVTGAGNLDCVNGTNNYTWPSVADEKSSNALIRVSFNDYPTYGPMTSASFKIHPKITVTPTPNATTKLKVGSTYANLVKWTYTGTKTTTVDIRYDTNGGAGGYPATQVIATLQAIANGTTGVTWGPIPDLGINANVKVKVFDPALTEVAGESPAFKVIPGITLTAPLGGVNRTANTTMTISWTYTSTAAAVGNMQMYYDLNSGKGPDNILGNVDDWTLIDTQLSTSCSAGTCSYSWLFNGLVPVPDNVLNTARIYLKSASDADIFDNDNLTGTDFKLGAGVSNLLPANGQVILAGSTSTNVTWTKDKGLSTATMMKIEYTNNASNASPTWVTITPGPGTSNTGSFLWTPIPGTLNDLKTDLRLRITQQTPDNAAVTLSGTGTPFAIKAPITVTAPTGNGTESWLVGTSQTITFTKIGALQSVDIYYASDGVTYGASPLNTLPLDVSLLADNTAYNWTWAIPTTATLTAGYVGKIKVKAVTPAEQATVLAQGISGGPGFQVKGSISSVLPSGATDLEVSGSKLISWTATGNIAKFRIKYRYNAGAWTEISPGIGVTGTSWTWTGIPNTISNDVDFRVEDYDNANVFAESAVNNLIKGKLGIVSPISTDIWTLGTTPAIPIRWNKTGTIGDLKIEYSTSGTFTAADVTAGYVFTIVNNQPSGLDGNNDYAWASGVIGAARKISDTGAIKISNITTVTGTELSVTSPLFKIRPSFTGTASPALNEIWFVGQTTKVITWSCNSGTKGDGSLPTVALEYNVDGGTFGPVTGAGALACSNGTNNYTWPSIPDERSDNATVRISYNDYTTINVSSPSFKIYPQITVSNPLGTDQLVVGTNYANLIKWTRTGTKSTSFKVIYSTDGTTYPDPANVLTALGTVADGTTGLTWNIPAATTITNTARIKVVDNANANVFGLSAIFKLKGGLTLTAPTGAGTTWTASSTTNTVAWTFTGAIATVKVYYDLNSGKGPDNIAGNADDWTAILPLATKAQTGTSGSNTLAWTMPANVVNTARVKITDLADETNVFSEGADFKIGGQFDITAPENGAVAYAEDTNTSITWTPVAGTGITAVKIEYTNDSSGASPTWTTLTTTAPNTGSYLWNPIPRTLADLNNDNRVRISQFSPLNASVVDTGTGSPFAIKGVLTVTTPSTGSESWNVASTNAIKFKKKGNLLSADVYYSYDGAVLNYVKLNTLPIDTSDATGVTDAGGNYTFNWTIADATTLTNGFSGRIKVKAVTPATQVSVESTPSTAIEVKGSVTLSTPSATGVVMDVGGTYAITWTKNGAVNNVQIHYSTNGGIAGLGTYPDPANLIFDGPSTPSTFTWNVPDKIGNNLRIRVRHKENPNVWSESANVFRIKGKLQLSAPEIAGLSYTVGTSQTISWTTTGTFSPVELHYDRDGNFATTTDTFPVLPLSTIVNCSPVAPAITCTGSASFTIEDKIGAANKVRVRGTGVESDVSWISTNPFKIVGALDVTAPESGQIWNVADTTRVITWNATGTVTNVKIEYRTSLGGPLNTIALNDPAHVAGANSYTWPSVADEKTETAYIRISDVNFPEVANESAAPFTIRPVLTVTSPVAAQRVVVGSSNAGLVKWTRTGTKTTTLDIKYDTNDGKGADGIAGNADDYAGTIATLVDASTGATGVAWNAVPDSISNLVRIKIVDNAQPLVFAVSPAFKIVGSVTFSEPLAGTYLNVGQTGVLIKWTRSGSFANVNIWYSTDGGTNFTTEITPSTSAALLQYSWASVPATPSNNVVIRVADTGDPATNALSGVLHIHRVYDITQPENGEVLAVGTSYDIKWNTTGGTSANVKLQYATNGGGTAGNWVDIPGATNLVNTNPGSFAWTIPNSISSQVKVRVVDLSDTDNWNESGTQNNPLLGIFKIRADLRLVAPNGNATPSLTDKLLVNSTYPIQWYLNGTMSTVKLQLSLNAGAYTDIVGAAALNAATGQTGCTPSPCWNWTVPNSISQQVRVRVVNEADTTVFDPSDYDFAIRGSFTWTYPTALGTVFKSGETKTLTWTTTGSMANVNLEYSTNNGSSYAAMLDAGGLPATNIVNSGTFNWSVPTNVVSKDVFLRVTGTNDPNSTTTTQKIQIAGVLNLTAPPGGARWAANTTQQIKWTTTGPTANIKIEHSLNGGTTWVTPAITDSVPGTGQTGCTPAPCFNWLVPTTTSPNVVIRLSDVITDSGTTSVTSSVFKIVGSFSFTAPVSTTIWPVTTGEIANPMQNIVWSTIGGVAQVNIRYSATGAAPWTFVAGPINDGGLGGSYAWTVPDAVGTTVKVLIEDAADPYPNTYTESALFTIRGDLKLTAPVGGEKWGVAGGVTAAYKTISWQRNGTIAQVYLDYSKSGAAGPWIAILNATSGLEHTNSGSLAWNVPDDMTTNAFMRVRNVSGPAVQHISPAAFKIMARFNLTSPAGGEVALAGQNYNPPNGMTWGKWGANTTNVKIDLATGVNAAQPCSAVLATAFDKVIELNTLNDGSQPWLVSVNYVTPAACLRIYDVNDVDSENRSVNPFLIRAGFTFIEPTTTTPDLQVGQPFNIIWQRVGSIANVKLEYSPAGNNFTTDIRPIEPTTDGIVPNVDAVTNDPTQGRYIWTVPDIEDTKDENIKLRLRDPNDAGAEALSAVFKIVPKFTVTFPNGNTNPALTDKLKVGHRVGATDTPYTLTWNSSSSPTRTPSVTLRYSTDGGVNYTSVIGTATTSTACTTVSTYSYNCSFVWASVNGGVPDTISTQARVRVEDTSDGVGKDSSDFNFKIIGNFKLNSPNGGGVYDVGDPLTLTWENIGTVANVELAYSTDSGSTFPNVFVPSTLNTASYNWTIPNAIGANVRVRVKSTTDDGLDISDNNFRIRGKLAMVSPTTGSRLAIGLSAPISWTATGSIPNVNIYYDTNDGKGADGIAGNADDYPYTIATNAPGCTPGASPPYTCTGSFTWPSVADTATVNARIKIVDARASDTDVIGISNKFSIVGNFTLLAPNGSEDWRVNTAQTLRYNWGGTMSNISYHYTKNAAADPSTIPAADWILIGTQTGLTGNGSGTPLPERTFSWTIPNDISNTVRVRVSDSTSDLDPGPNFVPDVYDVSNATFKIRGTLTLTSPAGNSDVNLTERWGTYDNRQITWTTTGTVPFVKIQYSNNDFTTNIVDINLNAANCVPVSPAVTCNATYNWSIPDTVLKDANGIYTGPNMVKVRLMDANDTGVSAQSNYPFKIDYFRTKWLVKDLLTNAFLTTLGLKVTKTTDETFIVYNQTGLAGGPTVLNVYLPYGNWLAKWTKTEYGDKGIVLNNLNADVDYSVIPLGPIFMETSAIHIYEAVSQAAYDPTLDKLTVLAWLNRDGSRIPGPTEAFFRIIDEAGVVAATLGSPTAVNPKDAKIATNWKGDTATPIPPHEPALPNASGYFTFTLNAPTGLLASKAYVGVAIIKISTGGTFETPKPFEVTTPSKLQEVVNKVNTQLDKPLSQVEGAINTSVTNLINAQTATIQTKLDAQKTSIDTKLDTQTTTLTTKMDAQTTTINNTMTSFQSTMDTKTAALQAAADSSKASALELEKTAKRFSWKAVVSPNPALSGDTITLQAQGIAALKPVVSVYNHENKQIISSGTMTESSTQPGNYSYTFSVASGSFTPGKAYTYIVTETTTGGLTAGSGFVESMSLTALAGLASSAPEAANAAKQAVAAISRIEALMSKGGDVGGVKEQVTALKTTVDQLPGMLEKVLLSKQSPISDTKKMVESIQARLDKLLAGQEGFQDLRSMIQQSVSESPSVKEIRQRADNINQTVAMIGEITQAKLGKKDEPVVRQFYTSGSVKLRVMAANPSTDKMQYVPIKIYLPQEVQPKDIMDKGNLELSYDSEKSLYFVYKEKVPLAPKQTRVFEVELEDIWFVPKDTLEGLGSRTEHIIKRLEGTPYFDQGKLVAETIYGRLNNIATSQADESVSKELHIGLYRSNMKVLAQIEADIAKLEKMLVAVGAPPAPEILAESKLNLKAPSRATTWFVIFAILIFIGLLAAVFFFTWQAQARLASGLSEKVDGQVFGELHINKNLNERRASPDDESPKPPAP